MFKVCFVHFVDLEIADTQMFGVHYMPVWVYTLASYLRDDSNLEINLFDNRVSPLSSFPSADLYLFTGINQDYKAIFGFLSGAKSRYPNSKFILGGPIVWSYKQAGKLAELDSFDHLVVGDGEYVIRSLVEKIKNRDELPKIFEWENKFKVSQAIPMDKLLLDTTIHNYYGAVVEVSRGCPFLCEFCDIRIQKDNNQPHNYTPEKIIGEIDYFSRKGVTQILFACDNFIGDPIWAERVCDQIIEWKKRTGLSVNLYTWLTINIANYPKLLEKLSQAGFDMFFIGVESFDSNQLLETAKIQNVKAGLTESIKKIQSYGFIVVAGLIFGFDTETELVGQSTLDGILKSGLISGEPSLLTALPGTPLYKRMALSNRLRDGKLGLGGFKYQTNIKYLKSSKQTISIFMDFVRQYNQGSFQFQRFKNFIQTVQSEYLPKKGDSGYINVGGLFKLASKNKRSLRLFVKRLFKLLFSFSRFYYFLKVLILVISYHIRGKRVWKYFNFWLFVWSNSVIKFSELKPEQFDIGDVGDNFDYSNLIPGGYLNSLEEPIPEHKMTAQRKFTSEALEKFKNKKTAKA